MTIRRSKTRGGTSTATETVDPVAEDGVATKNDAEESGSESEDDDDASTKSEDSVIPMKDPNMDYAAAAKKKPKAKTSAGSGGGGGGDDDDDSDEDGSNDPNANAAAAARSNRAGRPAGGGNGGGGGGGNNPNGGGGGGGNPRGNPNPQAIGGGATGWKVIFKRVLKELGFNKHAIKDITDEEDCNTPTCYSDMEDTNVASLCKTIRKRNINISMKAEENLKLLCFFTRFHSLMGKEPDPSHMNVHMIRSFKTFKQQVEEHKDGDVPEIPKWVTDWPKVFESLLECFATRRGCKNVPLQYVVRQNEIPNNSGPFDSKDEELIAQVPLFDSNGKWTAEAKADSATVWNILQGLFLNHSAWTWVRPYQSKRDGRGAYLNLLDHFLGENTIDNQATAAETELQNTFYQGEGRRQNFDMYVSKLYSCFTTLEGLAKMEGSTYQPMDEASKVRVLMNNIKTSTLDPVKLQIYASPAHKKSLAKAVGLYTDFIRAMKASGTGNRTATIAAVSTLDDDGVEADMNVEDRYYKRKEYAKLTRAQKKGLRILREKRGHQPNKKQKRDKRNKNKDKDMVQISRRDVKKVQTLLTEKEKSDKSDESEEESEGEEPPPKKQKKDKSKANKGQRKLKNRLNAALQRN
jgi:hypothetical protein